MIKTPATIRITSHENGTFSAKAVSNVNGRVLVHGSRNRSRKAAAREVLEVIPEMVLEYERSGHRDVAHQCTRWLRLALVNGTDIVAE